MQIDRKLVQHVAKLAHLELSDGDAAHYETQLKRILGYVAVLDALPKGEVVSWREPLASGVERPDVVVPPLPNDVALANAPEKRDGAFQVPKIIE